MPAPRGPRLHRPQLGFLLGLGGRGGLLGLSEVADGVKGSGLGGGPRAVHPSIQGALGGGVESSVLRKGQHHCVCLVGEGTQDTQDRQVSGAGVRLTLGRLCPHPFPASTARQTGSDPGGRRGSKGAGVGGVEGGEVLQRGQEEEGWAGGRVEQGGRRALLARVQRGARTPGPARGAPWLLWGAHPCKHLPTPLFSD